MSDTVLFLDLDGVVNNHSKLQSGYCGFQRDQVCYLNWILDSVPDLKIVVTSSWRYMILKGELTLKGFEMLLLIGGVKAHNRVIGHTVADGDVADEPDHQDAEAWRVAGLKMRHLQIKRYTEENRPQRFVVLDDLPLDVPNLVQTDGAIGLTASVAAKVVEMLKAQP